jgi:hypothetical protein
MGFVYEPAQRAFATSGLSWTGTLTALLVMEDSTAGVDSGVGNLQAIRNLDEYDGANYHRLSVPTQGLTDRPMGPLLNLAELIWPALGRGSRAGIGLIIAKGDMPILFTDDGFPFRGNGGTLTLSFGGIQMVGVP